MYLRLLVFYTAATFSKHKVLPLSHVPKADDNSPQEICYNNKARSILKDARTEQVQSR
jgi:hypothetical protein